jgi:hypothetical protein
MGVAARCQTPPLDSPLHKEDISGPALPDVESQSMIARVSDPLRRLFVHADPAAVSAWKVCDIGREWEVGA